jgi:hypothetical protein
MRTTTRLAYPDANTIGGERDRVSQWDHARADSLGQCKYWPGASVPREGPFAYPIDGLLKREVTPHLDIDVLFESKVSVRRIVLNDEFITWLAFEF